MPVISRIELPPARLRGYGVLSGTFQKLTASGGPASALAIRCDSAGKAALTQAKLLADLTLLPGAERVTLQTPGGDLPATEAAGQGLITALRLGPTVTVLAAATAADLAALHRAHLAAHPGGHAYQSEAAVPMWLNRWDRHGFLFYSYTWQTPPAGYVPPAGFEGRKPGHDFAEQFHWARAEDVGFVFWDTEAQNDTAEGLMNDPWIDWAVRGAAAEGRPLHVNLSAVAADVAAEPLPRRDLENAAVQRRAFRAGRSGDRRAGDAPLERGRLGGDLEMGLIQSTVRKYAPLPSVVGWLEPHGETVQSAEDFMLAYGPAADRRYRQFLREKYKTVATVNARWHGAEKRLRSWGDVRVPEFASFLGWGPDALDLTGEWRIAYEADPDGTPYDTHNLNNGNRGGGSGKILHPARARRVVHARL